MNKWTFLLCLMILLQGCGSGGSNGSTQRTIKGAAFVSGPLEGASVAVSTLDAAGKTVIGETMTSDSGRWSIELPSDLEGALLVEVSGGTYQELAGGHTVSLRDSQSLKAVSWLAAEESGTINLSPFSTLAEALYRYRLSISDRPDEAVLYGNSQISSFIGFNVLNTAPSAQSSSLNNSSRFYHLLFGLSSVSDWISTVNGGSPGRTIELTAKAYDDLKQDGWFNGRGSGGDIFLGSVALGAETYRHLLALNMLGVVSKTPLSFSEIEPYAKTINDSDLYEFIQTDVTPLDLTSPVLFNLSHDNGRVIAGIASLSLEVASRAGLSGCDLLVDEAFYSTTQGELAPEYSIETGLLTDGAHSFIIKCTDVNGGKSEKRVDLIVANVGTKISNIQPVNGAVVGGNFTFSANVTDPVGIQAVRFDVNGTSYFPSSLSSPAVAIDTSEFTNQDQAYSLGIIVTSQVGAITTETVTFELDNVVPSAEWNLESKEVGSGSVSVTGQFDDNVGVSEARLFVDGALVGAFDSSPFSVDLDTTQYVDGDYLLTLDVVDQAGNSVILSKALTFDNTPPEVRLSNPWEGDVITTSFNIVAFLEDAGGVEESVIYLVDGVEYSTDRPAPRVSTELNVNNYSNNANHTIGVSVTDRAGFTTTETVTVFFDY